jgi:uncharacterized membrane protein YcaP (DUF421 family)
MDFFYFPLDAWPEKLARSVVVYCFLLAAFRLTGKRQVGQLSPFDLVVLLIISNVLQNAAIGDETTLTGGLIGAVTILVLNWAVTEVTYRSKRARRILETEPTMLIHNGRVLHANLERERITMDELHAALRRNGLVEPSQVRYAVLEENGNVSVIPLDAAAKPTPAPDAGPRRP